MLPYGFVSALYLLLSIEVRTRTVSADWPLLVQILDKTLHGNPFTIYADGFYDSAGVFHVYGYGPLALLLMAPFKLFSEIAKLPVEIDRWVTWLPYYFADILAALLVCRIAARSPLASRSMLAFVFAFFMLSWLVFFSSPVHSHFESVVLVLVLLGVATTGRKRYLLGGLLCGLGLLTKQTAIIVLIPQFFILLRSVGWKPALQFAGASAAVTAIVMLPYVIADPQHVWYMAAVLPNERPVAYQTTVLAWKAFPSLYSFMAANSNVIAVGLIVAVSGLAVLRKRIAQNSPAAFALFALSGLFVLDFEKWGLAHFFVMPFALLMLWELLLGRWPLAALLLTSTETIMYILNEGVGTRISFSALVAPLVLLLGGLTVYVLVYLFTRDRKSDTPGAAPAGTSTPPNVY